MKNIESNKYIKSLMIIMTVLLLSVIIMTVTFVFSSASLNTDLFNSYFKSIELIVMNIMPIFIFMIIVYMLSNRLWLSFLLSSILFVTASLVNKFKLTYRDDPFTFMDIKLFSESIEMTKRYDINFTLNIILILASLLFITILLKIFFKYKVNSIRFRVSLLLVIVLVSVLSFKDIYFDNSKYEALGDSSLINVWSEQQRFQSKGFVYPFLHSMAQAKEVVPDDYDEAKAIKDLNKYDYKDIPDDKKINVIGIMLEAYNDFSKFDNVEIDSEVYENFHEIQKESLHGNLVTNVFGGGTINTERGFITGYNNHPKYLNNTNSFVWYLKEQGYATKAMHPVYGWFYNRRNVNEFLGFDSFDYYENKYEKERKEIFDDIDFFDYIIEDYEANRDKGQPYFNFSVTYQNHGPYSNEKVTDREYLKRKPEYNESDYNIINNYLRGINETDKAIKKLIDYFENEEEPVMVVMFGDHNPWLGENDTGYKMMNIDMDSSSEEGFTNYYQTPYIIWGNSKAKEKLGKDFREEPKSISPNFLMSELFEYAGWEGNEYMQYITDIKKNIDVNHEVFFKEDGKYTRKLTKENYEKYENFKNLQYYYNRNFKENKN